MGITIKQRILTQNDCYKSGRTITPNSMQLHTIGTAQNTAQSLASYWNQGGIQSCVQYCVDAEQPGLVYQFLPDNRRPWADAGFGNNNSIAVELMQSDYMKYTGGADYIITDQAKFKADITRAYNTAVEFFAMKCKEYGWNPQEKMSNGLHRVYSHDEGRRLGLSSAHVDPTHIWNRYGWTMDQFRADVASAMKGVKVPVQTEEIKYKVRMTWNNEKSQLGAFVKYDKAVEMADANPGYTVFDLSGKALYTSKGLPSVEAAIAGQSKANSLTLLSSLPDYKGLPDSQQDYLNKVSEIAVKVYSYTRILPSVVIAQSFLENGGGTASDALELTKRSNLIGQKADLINNTWKDQTVWDGTSFSKKTPEVYNGVPTTITDSFRVFPNYAYSILDYEMFLTHVKLTQTQYKYRDVVGMTDPKAVITLISQRGYATDPRYIDSVMRIINQYDLTKYDNVAINSLQDGGQVVIPTTTTPTTPSPAPTSKPSVNAVQNAVLWALKVAEDPQYGYDQGNRWGPNYDCSSFVISAFQQAGIKVKTAGATYTGNMYDPFIKCGFVDVTSKINKDTGAGLIRGDVLLNKVKHTALYIGDGNIVHASRNEKGGATGGVSGDQDGKEILTRGYYNSPWDCVLRYSGVSGTPYNPQPTPSSTSSGKKTVYRVQVGVFTKEPNRNELINSIKETLDLDCFTEAKSDGVHVYCGSFGNEKLAKERKSLLQKNKFQVEIKKVQI